MTGYSACTRLAAFGALGAFLVGCSVDDRALVAGAGAGGGSAGTGAELDSGVAAAAGQPALDPLPVCDYSGAVAEGCETLVSNPGFATDIAGWAPEMPSISLAWSAMDAAASAASGSLTVVNTLAGAADGTADRGAAQCLPTTPGQAYGFAADMFIPDGQGAGIDGGTFEANAALSIIFYPLAGCTGYSASSAISDLAMEAGVWGRHEGHAVAPEEAKSMLVRLDTLKNFQQGKFEADFDNVLIKAE